MHTNLHMEIEKETPMSRLSQNKRIILLLAILSSLILASCGVGVADESITVYSGDKYTTEIIFSFQESMMDLVGGTSTLEMQLDEIVQEGAAQGLNISWRQLDTDQENVISYQVNTSKTAITDADTDGFSWEEIEYNGQRAYRFEYTEFFDVSSLFTSTTLTLNAGKVLASNGIEMDGKSVRWINPSETPYAIVVPKGFISGIPTVGVLGILGVLLAAIAVLGFTGKLMPLINAGVASVKWRYQMSQYNSTLRGIEKERADQVSKLGIAAWEHRVSDGQYIDTFTELETLHQSISDFNEKKKSIGSQVSDLREKRAGVVSEFEPVITQYSEEQRTAASALSQGQKEITETRSKLRKAESEQKKVMDEIQSIQASLESAESSDAPDKEAKVRALTNAITALEGELTEREADIPGLQAEIEEHEAELQPFKDELDVIKEKLEGAQADKKDQLDDLDEQIKVLNEDSREVDRKIKEIKSTMDPLVKKLGPQVEKARPESVELSDLFTKLDELIVQDTQNSQQRDLLKVRLETTGKQKMWGFYILVIGILGSVIALIVMLTQG